MLRVAIYISGTQETEDKRQSDRSAALKRRRGGIGGINYGSQILWVEGFDCHRQKGVRRAIRFQSGLKGPGQINKRLIVYYN